MIQVALLPPLPQPQQQDQGKDKGQPSSRTCSPDNNTASIATELFSHAPLDSLKNLDWDRLNEYIANGMALHEDGNLTASMDYFEKAAKEGTPLGLYFYGLCLRHGWGIEVNQVAGFTCFFQAASNAIHLAEMEISKILKKKETEDSSITFPIQPSSSSLSSSSSQPQPSASQPSETPDVVRERLSSTVAKVNKG